MTQAKPFYLSKRFWGAVFTLFSMFGLSRYGVIYDDAANTIVIDLNTLTEKVLAGTGAFGVVLHVIGAFVAKHRIKW